MSVSISTALAEPVRIDCTRKPEPRALRQALGRFATGITVITTRAGSGQPMGMTANSFSSVSLDPPMVLWSLRRQSPSLPAFLEAGCFAVNVLSAEQGSLPRHFATPIADKFEGVCGSPAMVAARCCPAASPASSATRIRWWKRETT